MYYAQNCVRKIGRNLKEAKPLYKYPKNDM